MARLPAHERPEGPAPITATRCPFFSIFFASVFTFFICQSATKRSRRPIPTDSPFIPRTHFDSHCVSCGQTLPQTAGRELVSVIILYAPSKSPSATRAINSGICTATGHPATHGRVLQLRQRFASSIACSSVYPSATSSKFLQRTQGSCCGMGFFFGDIFAIIIQPPF